MKKYVIFILLSSIFTAEVAVERALVIAENFHFSKNDPRNSEFNFSTIEQYELNNNEIFHIINIAPSGFILISANSETIPVLGYSFNNNFDLDSLPLQLTQILDSYKENIDFVISNL